MDEILEQLSILLSDSSLDEDGVNGFLHIINTLEKDKDIFVISHHGESFYDNFDNIIKFEKNGNFSIKKVDTFIEWYK